MIKDTMQAEGLTRTVLALLFTGLLAAASFWVLHLFVVALLWAAMIVVSTWPILLKVQARLWGRRSLAALVMTLALLLVVVLPLLSAVAAIVGHSAQIGDGIHSLTALSVPPPPGWIGGLPVVGEKVVKEWQHVIVIGPEGISSYLTPYAGKALGWFTAMSGSVGRMLVQFLLTVFVSAILYQRGDAAAAWLRLFARRIAGLHGEQSLVLAAQAIRAVALGVVGTAVIQAVLSGLGLALSGVPGLPILTVLVFMFCLAQVGPMPVLIPAVIWLFWKDQSAWGIALGAWTLFLGTIDNIITPWLMKKGVDLPMLLVFAGVVGGLMVFGIIGLFVGPVVLAVTYTLLDAWVTGAVPAAGPASLEAVVQAPEGS
jgi:predicted PurR-regulated permease PerM